MKSILDRIERKEELDMRKKKKDEIIMKQKEKKELHDQVGIFLFFPSLLHWTILNSDLQ